MTVVELFCDNEGCIKRCRATGHAGFAKKGRDIVCASESILLSTALDLLSQTLGVRLKTEIPGRGSLDFCILEKTAGNSERLKCIADFIRLGISKIAKEFPKNLVFLEKIES